MTYNKAEIMKSSKGASRMACTYSDKHKALLRMKESHRLEIQLTEASAQLGDNGITPNVLERIAKRRRQIEEIDRLLALYHPLSH